MIGIALLALLALAPQELPAPVEVGAWLVAPATRDSCAAVTELGPNVMVSIRQTAKGAGQFVFSDDRWKLVEGQPQPATLSWDNWATTRQASFVARKTQGGAWILAMDTEGSFTENLAQAKHLWLRVPGVGFDQGFDVPVDVTGALASCNAKLP